MDVIPSAQIARKEAGLNAHVPICLAFDREPLHPLDQMARQIEAGIALGSRVVGAEPDKHRLRRDGKRDFEMGQEDIVGDSGHIAYENK